MQSLPYSNDIPYTIKNSLLPNGVQRSKNLIILNQFLNENSSLSTTQSLMDTDCSFSETKTNNSIVHLSKSNENELHNLNQQSQNVSFNLTEFIADRIEKSLHEDPKNIKNNKLTKVVAKTVYPINPISSFKCQITSPIHITPKNSIFPLFKNNVHKPQLLYASSLKNETQKSLNLHCLERMDDGNILPHNEECLKSTEQKMSIEHLNKDTSIMPPQMKQPSNSDLVYDLIHFKKVDKPSPYKCNSNILPVSPQKGRDSNSKESNNFTSISLTSVQNFTKLGVLSLPSKTLNINAALTNSILPNNDDSKKMNHSKTFVSPQSLRSPGNIVGINAKEFQHLIFMNHKSHDKMTPHLTSSCAATTLAPKPVPSGGHEVISFPNKSHLVKLSAITQQQPNHVFAPSFLDFNKPPPPPPASTTMREYYNQHHQTSKFMVNNSGGGVTKYANSYNYLTSPPHSILSFNNYNNIGSHNIVTCPGMSVRSTPLIMSTHATEPRVPPPFSIYGAPAIIKPPPVVTQETPSHNLLSYNHQCNPLMTKSSFYTLEKSSMDQGGLLKSPLSASHQVSNPSSSFSASTQLHTMHLSSPLGSPRKKQPRKQNLTLNKRGPELPDIDHYARCLEIDSTSPAQQQPAFTFDSYTGRSAQKYKKSSLAPPPLNATVKKYREKGPKPNDLTFCKKSWKGGNMPLAGLKDQPTDHRYRRPKAPTHHNYDKGEEYENNEEVVRDINQHPPLQTLLQCASVVSGDKYNAKTVSESLSFSGPESKCQDRPALARGKYKREKRALAAMLPGKKRKLDGSKKAGNVAALVLPDEEDLKSDPLPGVDEDALDPEEREEAEEPRYIVDEEGVRWKVLSAERGPSPPTLLRITDNNSFYQNYKPNAASSAPLHHYVRREDVKPPKDFHQHNTASGSYAALELFLTTSLATPSLHSPPHTTPNPYQSPSTLSNPSAETIKDSCLKPATWRLLSLTSQLDYIIHRENQHIKYLRSYKDAVFEQKLVGKLDGTSKSKLQSKYLRNYVDHRTDPDVKLYELIMASLQRSMFVKNELLESRRMLLTSLTTEYQSILMHGIQNIAQLNNGSYPNRLCSSSGPVYNLFCSIAKKVKR